MLVPIYDHNGNPVRTSDLREEVGRATVSGVRSPYRQGQAAGMRPERLARLLRAADDGDTAAFFTLASEIEERDLHYGSVLGTRKLGVTGIAPTIEAISERRIDEEIADGVRELVSDAAFSDLMFNMLDALGKGISLNEIIWETSAGQWRPRAYAWRDPRWFTWDSQSLTEPLIITDANPTGEKLAPYKWIIHTPQIVTTLPLRGGLARPAVIAWAMKSYTVRDWMSFMEIYGVPFRVGTYQTNTDKDALLDALMTIGADACGVIPEGTKIEFVSGMSSANASAFVMTAEFWDKQVSKRVLGQTMSTDEGQGRGKAQAVVQNEVRLDIKRHDAARLCATVRQQLITPYVRLNYGEKARIPTIRLETETAQEIDFWMTSVERFVKQGGRVEEAYVRDRLRIPEPDEGARLLSPTGSLGVAANDEPNGRKSSEVAPPAAESPPEPDDESGDE